MALLCDLKSRRSAIAQFPRSWGKISMFFAGKIQHNPKALMISTDCLRR
jgi:hypothetical protein